MRTNRRQFLGGIGGGIGAALTGAAAQSANRPNVIVIMADDMGFGDLGANGATDAKTPNMDRLAASGIRFTDWHANSPVCSPSRASLLTGKYPQHAGVPNILPSPPNFDQPGLKAGEATIASELRKAGYRTGAVGKWHLGSAAASRPRAQGFDQFFGFYAGWTDYYSHTYYRLSAQGGVNSILHDMWRNETEVFESPVYQTELLGREAKAFVAVQSAAQPFFLYLAFGAPHYPMIAPQQYLDRFPRRWIATAGFTSRWLPRLMTLSAGSSPHSTGGVWTIR
jgi:arylsulfatase A-like enzyme